MLNLSKAEAKNSSGLDLGENALRKNYEESPSLGCQIFNKKNKNVVKQKGPLCKSPGMNSSTINLWRCKISRKLLPIPSSDTLTTKKTSSSVYPCTVATGILVPQFVTGQEGYTGVISHPNCQSVFLCEFGRCEGIPTSLSCSHLTSVLFVHY